MYYFILNSNIEKKYMKTFLFKFKISTRIWMKKLRINWTHRRSIRQNLHLKPSRLHPPTIPQSLHLQFHIPRSQILTPRNVDETTMLKVSGVEGFDFGTGGEFAGYNYFD